MSFCEILSSKPFSTIVEVIPPEGNDLTLFKGEVELTIFPVLPAPEEESGHS